MYDIFTISKEQANKFAAVMWKRSEHEAKTFDWNSATHIVVHNRTTDISICYFENNHLNILFKYDCFRNIFFEGIESGFDIDALRDEGVFISAPIPDIVFELMLSALLAKEAIPNDRIKLLFMTKGKKSEFALLEQENKHIRCSEYGGLYIQDDLAHYFDGMDESVYTPILYLNYPTT